MILINCVAADSVAATDRGLAYGDGVFRTLLVRQGKPRCWSRHYRKLAQDCAAEKTNSHGGASSMRKKCCWSTA